MSKHKFHLLVFILLLSTMFNISFSQDTKEEKLVADFMLIMCSTLDQSSMMDFISPAYMKENKLSKKKYSVNNYSFTDFEIENFSAPYVTVLGYGPDKKWAHRLKFLVVNESGNLYLYPSGYTDNFYIHPWNSVTTDVDVSKKNKSKETDKEKAKELVKDFLELICKDERENKVLMNFISPKYFKENNLKKKDYSVNTYYPKSFSIEDFSDGIVTAKIWGENKTWIHRLHFKIIKENEELYFYPGHHSESYVDPWYKADEYLTDKVKENLVLDEGPSKIVTKLLTEFCKSTHEKDVLWSTISPKYLKKNKLNKNTYSVNSYYPDTYEIESVKNGVVKAVICGKDKSWCHRLTITTTEEDGNYYIIPGEFDDEWIHPWDKVESNVQEKSKVIVNEENAIKYVTNFLKVLCGSRDNSIMMEYISPTYMEKNNLKPSKYKVNYYSADDFAIQSYSDGIVEAKVYGRKYKWAHLLTFKLVVEDGKIYLSPGRHSDSYVDPWIEVTTDVKYDIEDNAVQSDGIAEKKLISDFLSLWCKDDRDNKRLMSFIAPSYFIDKKIKKADFKVNTYYPKEYMIDSFNDGKVKARIIGDKKGWTHKVEFKVVYESGDYYIYPGEHSDDYIDPWHTLETYVK